MAKAITFTRSSDGMVTKHGADGGARPVKSRTDWKRIDALSEAEIEAMAASDRDHPALDAEFWKGVDDPSPVKQAISIKLDRDVLDWFKARGRGYQTRINAVLRRYMELQRKAG